MRKRLFSASIFGACIICVIFVKNQFSYCLMHDCNYGMEALIRDGSVDNLFVGSSTFRQGLDIDILEEQMGDSCYILSYNGNQPCTEYMQIKKLIENGVTIKNLYIDMYAFTLCREPGLDDEKLLMELTIPEKIELFELLPDKSFTLFWQMFVSANNEQIVTWPINKQIIDSQFKKGGSLLRSEGMDEAGYESIGPIFSSDVMDEVQLNAIEEIIDLCDSHNVNLCFLETPKAEAIMQSSVYNEIMIQYRSILEDNRTDSISAPPQDVMRFDDFADGVHLSYKGRATYTNWLIDIISNL